MMRALVEGLCQQGRRSAAVVGAVGALLVASGCVDFDDLRTEADAAPDAQISDMATDEGALDLAPPTDGPPIDGPTDFCSTRCLGGLPCFCADFDDVATPSEGWEETPALGMTRFSVEDAVSPPRSVEMTAPGSTTGELGSSFVVYKHGLQSVGRTVLLEGSWQLGDYDRSTFGNFEFFSVTLGAGTRVSFGNSWTTAADSAWIIGVTRQVPDAGFTTDVYPVDAPPTARGQWVRFALRVHFAPDATGSVSLSWNDSEVLAVDGVITASENPAPGTSATMSASIGGGTRQGLTPDLWMLFDDVAFSIVAD